MLICRSGLLENDMAMRSQLSTKESDAPSGRVIQRAPNSRAKIGLAPLNLLVEKLRL